MNEPETTTETIERTEAVTTTETVTKAQCPHCQLHVDADELVTVGVGGSAELTAVCLCCAEALFGYEGDADWNGDGTSSKQYDAEDLSAVELGGLWAAATLITWKTVTGWLADHGQQLVSLAIGLMVTAVTLSVGMNVASEAASQLSAAEVSEVGAPLDPVPLVLFTIMAWLVFETFRAMNRY